ncbi:MAG TPA: hypothetical protein VIS06_22040 [Mycobacteriales bacterium]
MRQINPPYVRLLGTRPVRPGDVTYRSTDPIPDGDTQPQPGWGYPIRDAVDLGRLEQPTAPVSRPRRRLRDHGLAVIACVLILIAVTIVL